MDCGKRASPYRMISKVQRYHQIVGNGVLNAPTYVRSDRYTEIWWIYAWYRKSHLNISGKTRSPQKTGGIIVYLNLSFGDEKTWYEAVLVIFSISSFGDISFCLSFCGDVVFQFWSGFRFQSFFLIWNRNKTCKEKKEKRRGRNFHLFLGLPQTMDILSPIMH